MRGDAENHVSRVGSLICLLTVDGETFEVHADGHGFEYRWVSGPLDGTHGFGSQPNHPTHATLQDHVSAVRDFLCVAREDFDV